MVYLFLRKQIQNQSLQHGFLLGTLENMKSLTAEQKFKNREKVNLKMIESSSII